MILHLTISRAFPLYFPVFCTYLFHQWCQSRIWLIRGCPWQRICWRDVPLATSRASTDHFPESSSRAMLAANFDSNFKIYLETKLFMEINVTLWDDFNGKMIIIISGFTRKLTLYRVRWSTTEQRRKNANNLFYGRLYMLSAFWRICDLANEMSLRNHNHDTSHVSLNNHDSFIYSV